MTVETAYSSPLSAKVKRLFCLLSSVILLIQSGQLQAIDYAGLKKKILKDGRESCIFKIQESTKHELVSIGSDGNILRWGAGNPPERGQQWALFPSARELLADKERSSLSDEIIFYSGQGNREVMGVDPIGNVRRWQYTGEAGQRFRLEPIHGSNTNVYIHDAEKDERITVMGFGNIARSAALGPTWDGGQRFKLLPTRCWPVPTQQPKAIAVHWSGHDAVGIAANPVPKADEYNRVTQTTKPYLRGTEYIPSVFVRDPNYRTNPYGQVTANPYYALVNIVYWKATQDVNQPANTAFNVTLSQSLTVSQQDRDTMQHTVGTITTLSGSVTLSRGAEAGAKGAKVTANNEISVGLTQQWQNIKSNTISTENGVTFRHTASSSYGPIPPIDKPRTVIVLNRIEGYRLYRSDGSEVAKWDLPNPNPQFKHLVMVGE